MKAIETVYRGTLFRSRLEARWAEFFDHIGVVWQYEPEGYTHGDIRYLPDFWLALVRSRGAGGGVFFEVKASSPTEGERHKARMLAQGSARPVIIATRSPDPRDVESLDEYIWLDRCEQVDTGLQFARCDNCGQCDIGFYASDEPACPCARGTFNPFNTALVSARAEFPNYGRWEVGRAA